MRRWHGPRSVKLAVAMIVASVVLAGCSTTDAEKKMRFGWPTGVTKQAERMRVLWTWSSVAALVVGVLVWGLIFWCCIRYRKRGDDLPRQTKENLMIELVYSIAPFFIIAGLFYYTVVAENYVDKLGKPDYTVTVTAFKWNWQFAYNGVKYNDSSVNTEDASTVGTSTEIPILVVPRDKKVRVVEHSADVIHSFWVPEFLFKRDVIPHGTSSTSLDNQFQFTATKNGHYVGRCAELCGTYHSQMNFEVRVVDESTYLAYTKKLAELGPNDPSRQAEALQSIGENPVATTTHPFNTDRTASTVGG